MRCATRRHGFLAFPTCENIKPRLVEATAIITTVVVYSRTVQVQLFLLHVICYRRSSFYLATSPYRQKQRSAV